MTTTSTVQTREFKDLDTYYATTVCSEYDSGYIVWDTYIDPEIIDETVRTCCPFQANTCRSDVYTTNPDLKIDKGDIYYISPEEISDEFGKDATLYDCLFGGHQEFPAYEEKGCYFSDGNIEEVSEVLEEISKKNASEEDFKAYKALKAKIFG